MLKSVRQVLSAVYAFAEIWWLLFAAGHRTVRLIPWPAQPVAGCSVHLHHGTAPDRFLVSPLSTTFDIRQSTEVRCLLDLRSTGSLHNRISHATTKKTGRTCPSSFLEYYKRSCVFLMRAFKSPLLSGCEMSSACHHTCNYG